MMSASPGRRRAQRATPRYPFSLPSRARERRAGRCRRIFLRPARAAWAADGEVDVAAVGDSFLRKSGRGGRWSSGGWADDHDVGGAWSAAASILVAFNARARGERGDADGSLDRREPAGRQMGGRRRGRRQFLFTKSSQSRTMELGRSGRPTMTHDDDVGGAWSAAGVIHSRCLHARARGERGDADGFFGRPARQRRWARRW